VAATAAVVLADDAVSWLRERGLTARLVATDGGVVHVGGWPAETEAA
jgi:thiamine biosynthesis lipoprotein